MSKYETHSSKVIDAGIRDGAVGLGIGLAGTTAASLLLQKYCIKSCSILAPFYRGLTMAGKLFFIVAGSVTVSLVAAEKGIHDFALKERGGDQIVVRPKSFAQRMKEHQVEVAGTIRYS